MIIFRPSKITYEVKQYYDNKNVENIVLAIVNNCFCTFLQCFAVHLANTVLFQLLDAGHLAF
jgi:hypothetical protein